jgi:DNA polymerase-3 subunit epsilon
VLPSFLKRWIPGGDAAEASSTWPEPLREYMRHKKKLGKRTPLGEVRFVVFDTETSGLDLSKNRLLSIAAVAMNGLDLELDDTFDVMVEQTDVGGADAAVVHGLISSDLIGGLPEHEAAARFLAFARDSVLVAHHAAFDLRMLQKAIAEYRGAKIWNPTIDTAKLAERVEVGTMTSTRARGGDDRESYRLDSLVVRYGIEVPERHTAAGDVFATALLFQRLLRRARRRGISVLGDLLAR